MSHIAEEYAKSLGVRIGQPIISDHFYPILTDNYITFHTDNKKSPARHYDHWGIVFNLIKQKLTDNNIDIVQVGGPEDPVYKECNYNTLNAGFKQMAYVIKKSKLHFGIDSLPVHIASVYDKPVVGLYSNLYPECSKPIWNKLSKSIHLAPDFSETKPSFSDNESPKRVNEIPPENVAKSILDLLGIENDLENYETLHIGHYYQNKVTEVVPDFIPDQNFNPETVVNLRCDYGILEGSLEPWMKHKVNLMIDKKIDPNIIYENRSNIAGMTIFMDKREITEDYLNFLSQLDLKYNLVCKDKDLISDIRMEFFDYTVEEYVINSKKDVDSDNNICDNTFYHSNKTLISKNKHYSSKAAWKQGIEKTGEPQKIIDIDEFWEEIEHLNMYNYVKNEKNRKR